MLFARGLTIEQVLEVKERQMEKEKQNWKSIDQLVRNLVKQLKRLS